MRCKPLVKATLAFTLVEVMTATMIVALLSFSLYRFISGELQAVQISQQTIENRESLQSVVAFLRGQLGELNPQEDNQLLGEAKQFHGQPSDEITWLTWSGQGVLTSAADGQYRVTLAVQPVSESSSDLELGLRRQRIDRDAEKDVDFYTRGAGNEKYNWLPLVHPVAAIEIRYFDPQLNDWLDRWADPKRLPTLVKVRLWRNSDDPPLEVVLPVPASHVQR